MARLRVPEEGCLGMNFRPSDGVCYGGMGMNGGISGLVMEVMEGLTTLFSLSVIQPAADFETGDARKQWQRLVHVCTPITRSLTGGHMANTPLLFNRWEKGFHQCVQR